jgi:hypothetical protein
VNRSLAWLSCALAGLLPAPACDLAEDDLFALRIVTPADNQSFSDAQDTDPYTAGMQVEVRVETEEDEVPVELWRLSGGKPEVAARTNTLAGVGVFSSVTLDPGANRLQVSDVRSGRTSVPITLYFADSCGSISFLDPAPPATGTLILGPRSNGTCGQSYLLSLLAGTGLRDGTRVSVLVDGVRAASGTTRGGTLLVPEVLLPANKPLELSLLVEGGSCPAVPFPADIVLDCMGPACEISSLQDGALLTSNDDKLEKVPGLNLDITVTTDAEGALRPIELLINGNQENAYSAASQGDPPSATFSEVSLPEGTARVTAVCRDAAGAATRSQRTFLVDTSGCTVSVINPLPGTLFVATSPGEERSVGVTAALGSDCAKASFAVSGDASCSELSGAAFRELTLGQTTVTEQLTLTESGNHYLCVGTLDARGNPSTASVLVRYDASP